MEIAEIKQQLTLSAVLAHYGLKPDKYLRLLCPFHDDKTPSLQVYYKTHTAYCFSSNCKTHGKPLDVIDFVMHKESCSKHEAILKCKQLIGGDPSETRAASITPRVTLGNMFTYFKNGVHNGKAAREYLASRGLDHAQIEVGYNTGQFHHGERKNEQLIADCLSLGLLTIHDHKSKTGETAYRSFAKNCIVFALRDRVHQVCGLYFRSTINDDDQKHFYLKDRRGLYPGYPSSDTKRLILTEAIIDAATLLQQSAVTKDYSVLACYGTNGFSAEHQAAIGSLLALQEIVFAFDSDAAGRKATEKYAGALKQAYPQLRLTTLELPAGEDINSVSLSHDASVFVHLLESRKEIFLSTESLSPASAPVSSSEALDSSSPHKLVYRTAHVHYCIPGGVSKALDSLKVTLVVERTDNGHKSRNKVDLYEDRQVEKLCREIGEKLLLDKTLLEADLQRLVDLLDEHREADLRSSNTDTATYPMTAAEHSAAETFLKHPQLITQLSKLLGDAGIVGEETNRLFLLLIALSYKMAEPLHALIQGSSGSGKTRLLKQISDCMPPEKVTKLTRVSDKVLYNYPEHYFINRLLCLEDIDGLSEEAEFALRELQSNGELNSATSIKLDNGQITSGQKTVKGPIASLACTTRGELYEDNMSRVFLLAVDESAAQTNRILDYQNRKAAGDIDSKKEQDTRRFIQQLVRALQPLEVINPYASKLRLPQEAHKIRRLNDLFLNFVKMITLLHQYQRKRDSKGRLIAEISDLETATDIMFESIILKVDELDGSLRQFYEQLKTFVVKKSRQHEFTRFEVREATGVGKTQQHFYINRLVELCYIQQYGHANRGFRYRIVHWDNYGHLRERIKTDLSVQLSVLKNRTPGMNPNASEHQTERQD